MFQDFPLKTLIFCYPGSQGIRKVEKSSGGSGTAIEFSTRFLKAISPMTEVDISIAVPDREPAKLFLTRPTSTWKNLVFTGF